VTSGPSDEAGRAVTIVVGEAEDGLRLDVLLAAALEVSRSAAAQRIDDGGVTVGGRPARRSRTVVAGDVVEVAEVVPEPVGPAPALPPIRYRDEHLVVIAKPPGLVVHPGAGQAERAPQADSRSVRRARPGRRALGQRPGQVLQSALPDQ
jgi:23S rRNA-/tRNA-specific pseudouridylate synthase